GASEVGELFSGPTSLGTLDGDKPRLLNVPDGERWLVNVTYLRNHVPDTTSDAHLYLGAGSQAELGLVTEQEFELAVLPGSDIFAQSGPYARGVDLEVADSQVLARVQGCLGMHFINANSLSLNCYDGQCSYRTKLAGDLIPIDPGTQVTIRLA